MLAELDEERKSKPPPARQPTPAEKRPYAEAVAEEVVNQLILPGNRIDTRKLTPLELSIYARKKGLALR